MASWAQDEAPPSQRQDERSRGRAPESRCSHSPDKRERRGSDTGPETSSCPARLDGRHRSQNRSQPQQPAGADLPCSKRQLSDYRLKLTRDMSARVGHAPPLAAASTSPKHPSPAREVLTPSPVLPSSESGSGSGNTTTSAGSVQTVRAAAAATKDFSAPTPSYPFPRVPSGASQVPPNPALNDVPEEARRPRLPAKSDEPLAYILSEKLLPTPPTPASAADFAPRSAAGGSGTASSYHGYSRQQDVHPNPDLPSPSLYDLALALSSEPGLDAWWTNVIQVTTEWYKAERVALAVPADATDVENMPWGQRATFNAHEGDDELSLGYIGRDSNAVLSNADATPLDATSLSPVSDLASPPSAIPLRRPDLTSRYSDTAFEHHRNQKPEDLAGTDQPSHPPLRPALSRWQTSGPDSTQRSDAPKADSPPKPYAGLNHAALEEHDAAEGTLRLNPMLDVPNCLPTETRGRVLPVLQALDYEADPLIDHNGVQRVLDRGHVVALTRSYPYLKRVRNETDRPQERGSAELRSEQANKLPGLTRSLSSATRKTSRPSSIYMKRLNGAAGIAASKPGASEAQRPRTPMYEECEQLPPSPWAQSPAPSPAVRPDPDDNPFFKSTTVDEDSFNPASAPEDYKDMLPPPTIGVENAWTVLHVPLFHPHLSKPSPSSFRLDKTKMERRSSPRRNPNSSEDGTGSVTAFSAAVSPERPSSQPKQVPIAILSILSPIIPYPSNLRHSLEFLAPHLATSFSLCLHYSNLEAEVSGLHRRRHELGGFGGIDVNGNPFPTSTTTTDTPYMPLHDTLALRSMAGSTTSYSDNSIPSRSALGTPNGTPGWDSTSLNMFLDRRVNVGSGTSPGLASLAGDGLTFGLRPSALGHFSRPATTPGGSSSSSAPRAAKLSAAPGDKRIPASAFSLTEQTSVTTAGEGSLSRAKKPPAAFFFGLGSDGCATLPPDGDSNDAGTEADKEPVSPVPSNIVAGLRASLSSRTEQKVATAAASKEGSLDELARSSLSNKMFVPSPFGSGSSPPKHRHGGRSMHRYSYSYSHSQLHSHGADFATTFPSLPPSASIKCVSAVPTASPAVTPSLLGPGVAPTSPVDMPPPSDRLKGLILDSLPAHVFVAMPQTGAIVWVNSRYLAYRGQTVESLAQDPWVSIHPDDREEYLKAWSHSVRTGDQFSRTVRIRRFDGSYRWFHARAVASRDRRNSIVQFLGSYMDIHDQHIAELKAARQEEIEVSEAKHRILANLIPQIVFTANEEEGVTFVNEQWLSYTGQSSRDALGLGFMNFVHPDDLAKCTFIPVPAHLQRRRQQLRHVIASGGAGGRKRSDDSSNPSGERTPETGNGEGLSELAELARRDIIIVTEDDNGRPSYTTEVRVRSKTGDYRWHLVRCVETGTEDFGKGRNSYFGSATDINGHKLLETKLKEAMDSKTRFLSNMSHEIRTPLIGISGMVSFLQDTTLNEEQRDYTNTIQNSASSLLMIINDILDLSKVDAGMMKLSFEWFHTRSLIEDVNELVSTMAIGKGLELNYIVEADVPGWVKGDRVRMRQVLLNVIGNAIKFTARGEVFSCCRVVRPSPEPDRIVLEFSVTDTGQGFTKEEADLIFKPFSQIDGSSTRQHGGSGLGLVISRQLVELHGGKMEGTAEPGKGSTFTFSALFGLPTESDHPSGELAASCLDGPVTSSSVAWPGMGTGTVSTSFFLAPSAVVAAAAASAAGSPGSLASTSVRAASEPSKAGEAGEAGETGEAMVSEVKSPTTTFSSDSDMRTTNLTRFSEAARASGQDLSQMSLRHVGSVAGDGTEDEAGAEAEAEAGAETLRKRPSALSILIICPQMHSREATTQHIEMTLPKGTPHRLTSLATVVEAQELIQGGHPEMFTHVVINLPSPQEILDVVNQLHQSTMLQHASLLVLSDSVQRQAVNKLAAGTRYNELLSTARVTYIYKPVKPSRFAVIFDPAQERDLSIDHNRSSAERLVETQKQSYVDLEQRMGNRGYKVLLVEDNLVNQKVLKKYLHKVGVDVDVAADGVECVEAVLSHAHEHYSFILCDLHMPRKDGYQACRDIREWEATTGGRQKPIPIIALSANVMSDVHEKCVEAGFSKYITKPVDFVALSRALAEFF
ncbi:sensor histidine kinase response [Grosmannia clavigera kw1407]|uniref:Sensor histidine kinase response n=1 Tax=Grosmannia clavigera (strain kw1407 / UAMH 11150) TaxID=655863 RepID=F0XTZ9_GROCL|nr:sensor histidine kinase response [Grosmannia clavigera kw1407]EFW98618.1 sensor histidine kinase response [Grosmannia clavigera kw1407]